MLRHILTAYRCYLRLRLRSVGRMCCALPMVVKLLFTVVAVAVGYGLVRIEIPHDVEHLLSYADTLSWLRRGRLAFYPDRAAFGEVRQAIHSEAAEQVRGWCF